MPSSDVIKQEILTKRAIGKSIIKNFGLKDRLFVLTENDLAYYDGDEENKGKEKGRISLDKVQAVEKVAESTFNRPFCFQIIFDYHPLYIFARNDKQRDEWICILRKTVVGKGTLLLKYHAGAFIESNWTCCQLKVKSAVGCKNSFISSQGKDVVDTASIKKQTDKNNLFVKPPLEATFKVVAKYNYNPDQDTDLQLVKDHEYTVLNSSSDRNWWFARDVVGREGFIPSNYVANIEREVWYHPEITRHESDVILKDRKQKDGTFIVHDSSRPNMHTLSFCFQGEVKHYHIKIDQDGKHYISDRHHFDTIVSLIDYHKLNSAGLVTRLRFPYIGEGEPQPVTLGHGVFEIDYKELEIRAKIGHGQFGTVHEAFWKGRKKVAVKMMKEGTMEQHDFIEEAKVMQRFKHKNLVSMYGISYTSGDSLSIVVEYMVNGSLLDYLRRKKNALLNDHLLGIIFQVSSAMMYLEGEKFIHRDLAARNCLVGNNNVIKVCDFGLARYVLDDEYTASEGTKFPIRWAAPEVIDYTRFSSKSDVWAFGVLCWEVFTHGTLPYPKKNNQDIVEGIRSGYRLNKPTSCSILVYELMKNCWEQSPEGRPNFKEVYERLSGLAEDYEATV